MPKAGMQVRSLLGQEDVPIDKIEKILHQDPGLAVKVLRLANCGFFGVPIVYAEKEVLKIDHAEIGALILNKRSFPDELIKAVRWHHNPEGMDNPNPQADIVYLANLMCHLNDEGNADDDDLNMPYSSVLDRLKIDTEQYQVLADKARDWMKKLGDTLTFDYT
jgi:HD-like signal output (HDOD) protein